MFILTFVYLYVFLHIIFLLLFEHNSSFYILYIFFNIINQHTYYAKNCQTSGSNEVLTVNIMMCGSAVKDLREALEADNKRICSSTQELWDLCSYITSFEFQHSPFLLRTMDSQGKGQKESLKRHMNKLRWLQVRSMNNLLCRHHFVLMTYWSALGM